MEILTFLLLEAFCLLYTTFGPHAKTRFRCGLVVTPSRGKCFATEGSNPLHRPEYVAIIQDFMFHQASFRNMRAYRWFVRRLGLHLSFRELHGDVKILDVRERFEEILFCSRKDLPKGCRPIVLHSNGSLVKGYWRRRKGNRYVDRNVTIKDDVATGRFPDVIEIYRPNPNCGDVFRPLPLSLHKRHMRTVGGM